MNKVLLLVTLLVSAFSLQIACDNYLTLGSGNVPLSVTGGTPPFQFFITGLPNGLVIQNGALVATSTVAAGQYILDINVTDSNKQSAQKIVILNVKGNTIFTPTSSATTTTQSTTILGNIGSQNQGAGAAASSSSGSSSGASSTSTTTTTTSSSNSNPNQIDSLTSFFSQFPSGTPSAATSSSSSTSSSSNTPSVTDILNTYGSTTPSSVTYNTTYFPVTGTTTTTVTNITTIINTTISDTQKQDILQNDAASKAVFDAQTNAALYVSGNFSALQQITANRNMASSLITQITNQLQIDQNTQAGIIAKIKDAENNKSLVDSAVNNINAQIQGFNNQINQVNGQKQSLTSQKSALASQNAGTQSRMNNLISSLQSVQGQLGNLNSTLQAKLNQCNNFSSQITASQSSLQASTLQLNYVLIQIQSGNQDVANKQAIVTDLENQLAKAKADLSAAQNSVGALNNQSNTLNNTLIAGTQALNDLKNSLNVCNADAQQIQNNVTGTSANSYNVINDQLTQIKALNANETATLQSLAAGINNADNQIANLNAQIAKAKSDLAIVSATQPNVNSVLNDLYAQGNSINTQVQYDQQNLNASIARFQLETQNLGIATMNLQNARAQQQLADQAVNQLLAQQSNVLPYAVPTNQANPIIGQTIISPTVSITNWFNYLSANFGQIHPNNFNGNVTSLYNFQPSTSLRAQTVPCPQSGSTLSSYSGTIQSISNGAINVKIDGSQTVLSFQFPPCANLLANTPNYAFAVGDSVVVKGVTSGSSTVVQSLVCLH